MEVYYNLIALLGGGIIIFIIGSKLRGKLTLDTEVRQKLAERFSKRVSLFNTAKEVKWHPNYNLDHKVIDKEHQMLVNLISRFNKNIPVYTTPKQIIPQLKAIRNHAIGHYKREIELLKINNYMHLEEYITNNKALSERLDMAIEEINAANEDTISNFAAEMGDFFYEWLKENILLEDTSLKAYFSTLDT